MSITLTIRDQSTSPGQREHVFDLELPSESMTVRELIRERVYQEVDDYNRSLRSGGGGVFNGLVQPERDELALNGLKKPRSARPIDWKAQYEIAIEAYQSNRILILVGDHQTGGLDEVIKLDSTTEVVFLRLMMLAGG